MKKGQFVKGQIPWNKGKHPPAETIEKQKSTYRTTLLAYPEIRKKMSFAHLGKCSWNKGIPMREESKKKLSQSNRGRHNSPETEFKKGHITWNTGRTQVYTQEQLMRMSEARKGKPAWNKGISPTEEQIEKQRASMKKKTSSIEYRKRMSEAFRKAWSNPELRKEQSKAIKEYFSAPEARKKLSESLKGNTPWNKGKKGVTIAWNKGIKFPPESERTEQQIRIAKSSRNRILKLFESGIFPDLQNTKPERQMKEALIKRGYKEKMDFIHQYKFMDKFMCDFCFPKQKIIVEVNGDYWHANPIKYTGKILHPMQIKEIKRDKAKKAYIEKVDNGSWTYLVLWESDINKDVAKCINEIEKVLKSKT